MSLIDNAGLHCKAMRYYHQCLNDREIAKKLGVETTSVIIWRAKHKLASVTVRRLKIYMELYNLGLTDAAISEIFDTSRSAVSKWRRRRGLKSHYRADMEQKHQKSHIEIVLDYRDILNMPSKYDNVDLKSKESLYCDTEFLEKFLQKQLVV